MELSLRCRTESSSSNSSGGGGSSRERKIGRGRRRNGGDATVYVVGKTGNHESGRDRALARKPRAATQSINSDVGREALATPITRHHVGKGQAGGPICRPPSHPRRPPSSPPFPPCRLLLLVNPPLSATRFLAFYLLPCLLDVMLVRLPDL